MVFTQQNCSLPSSARPWRCLRDACRAPFPFQEDRARCSGGWLSVNACHCIPSPWHPLCTCLWKSIIFLLQKRHGGLNSPELEKAASNGKNLSWLLARELWLWLMIHCGSFQNHVPLLPDTCPSFGARGLVGMAGWGRQGKGSSSF